MCVRRRLHALSLICIVIMSLLSACDLALICDTEVISKATSPTGEYDLVLVRENCGTTTAYVHKVFLVESGGVFRPNDHLFVADKVEGIFLNWTNDSEALIEYKNARIFSYRNFRSFPDGEVYVREIHQVID